MKELNLKHFLSGWTKWSYPVLIWCVDGDRSQLWAKQPKYFMSGEKRNIDPRKGGT